MRELHVFLTSLMFYTRIPVPSFYQYQPEYTRESARYLTMVGVIVGSICAGVFWTCHQVFNQEISIILSMMVGVRVTGGFHEDGLADSCDGLGGGWERERILEIMKDSRIGTFGTLGLILVLGLKFTCINSLPQELIIPGIISAHVLSRLVPVRMLLRNQYVGHFEQSKAGSASHALSWSSLLVNLVVSAGVFYLLPSYLYALVLIPLFLLELYLFGYFKKWMGGYNGDALGATQQLSEVLYLLSVIGLWKYI